jgi:hypothetical protein
MFLFKRRKEEEKTAPRYKETEVRPTDRQGDKNFGLKSSHDQNLMPQLVRARI